jgi:hypothetical protein
MSVHGELLGALADWHRQRKHQCRFSSHGSGRLTKELALNLGSGGATVKAMTTNGGVRIKRTLRTNSR